MSFPPVSADADGDDGRMMTWEIKPLLSHRRNTRGFPSSCFYYSSPGGDGNQTPGELNELKPTFLNAQKRAESQRIHLLPIPSQGNPHKEFARTVLVLLGVI